MCFGSNLKGSRSEPESLKNLASSKNLSFGNFRRIPRMHSWQNWSFVASQFFPRRTIRGYKIVPSTKETFFKKSCCSRRFQFWDPCRKVLPKTGICSFQISKQSQNYVFFRKKTFWLKVFLWTHGMQFWRICRLCFTRNQKHYRPEPKKVGKVLFLLEKCPSESSAWHLGCRPDEPGVFLQFNVSSEKPWKYINLYLHPESIVIELFFQSLKFRFPHSRRKRLPTSGFSSIKISKQSLNYVFFQRNFLSPRVSLITWTAVLATLSNSFCQKPERFSFKAQKMQKLFISSRELSSRVFCWTPRKPSWQTCTFENQLFFRRTIGR